MGFGLDFDSALSGIDRGLRIGENINQLKDAKQNRIRQEKTDAVNLAIKQAGLDSLLDENSRAQARQEVQSLKALSDQSHKIVAQGGQPPVELVNEINNRTNNLLGTVFAHKLNAGGKQRTINEFMPAKNGGYHATALEPDGKGGQKVVTLGDDNEFGTDAAPREFTQEELRRLFPTIEAGIEFLDNHYADPEYAQKRADKKEDREDEYNLGVKKLDYEYGLRTKLAETKGANKSSGYRPTTDIQNDQYLREQFPQLTAGQRLRLLKNKDGHIPADIVKALDSAGLVAPQPESGTSYDGAKPDVVAPKASGLPGANVDDGEQGVSAPVQKLQSWLSGDNPEPQAPAAGLEGVVNQNADDSAKKFGGVGYTQSKGALPSASIAKDLKLTPQEKNLYQHHVNNMTGANGGKSVKNPDGSVSTVRQATAEVNGKIYSFPTVWDGKVLPPKEAMKRAAAVGWDKWPSYANEDEAETRYNKMHVYMEKDVNATEALGKQHPQGLGNGRNGKISPQAMQGATQLLLSDPSPEAMKEFDETFGIPGEAADIIKKHKAGNKQAVR